MTPFALYEERIREQGFQEDAAQRLVLKEFERIFTEVTRKPALWRWFKNPTPPHGLYVWGKVGTGKTYLMDLFFEALPFQEKLRLHFYRFMERVHQGILAHPGEKNPLQLVAKEIAATAKIVCFDEFFVQDVADAMILGNLLEALFAEGVCLVATSNVAPEHLYENGLNRQRFLPTIDLIQRYTKVVHLNSPIDYRLTKTGLHTRYIYPLAKEQDFMTAHFDYLAQGEPLLPKVFRVNAREVRVIERSETVLWLSFNEICVAARSQGDYIDLAKSYRAILVSAVRQMNDDMNDTMRRFIGLVDELYDNKILLILSAECAIADLYTGKKLSFEFQRTVSRLIEMQAQSYPGV